MIFRAAVCPGAPLLIPGLADGLSAAVPELVAACDRAVGTLRDVDRVLLLSSALRVRGRHVCAHQFSVIYPAGTALSSASLTGSWAPAYFTARLPGGSPGAESVAVDPPMAADQPPTAPIGVGVIVGAALLARAGLTAPVTAVDLADRTAAVDDLLAWAQTSADRVGLLVVAEGSASRGASSPGGGSAEADVLDARLATALAAGDPAALADAAAMDPRSASALLFDAAPALLALAGVTAARPPQRAELLLAQAPLGVGYLVATWSWSD